ncbi:MAG: hypothetical protein Q9172_000843 [Xanthocarpia lactea]
MTSFMVTMWHPLVDALFAPSPLPHRWHLLLLLPITLLLYPVKSFPYLFSCPFETYYVPSRRRGESIRALVYGHPERWSNFKGKRPLHLDVHGGGFIGGLPEDSAPLCTQLAETTGAVVVSVTYRFAPRYPFPAAHDDVADALAWLMEHAGEKFNANTELVTVSGISAGGNLALGATLGAKDAKGDSIVKGAVTFYSPVSPLEYSCPALRTAMSNRALLQVDLRLPPQEKRKPPGFPSFDLTWFMLPLFDAYTEPGRVHNIENPRLHPTLASLHDLPASMLFIIPTIDFLMYEQLELVERLQSEAAEENKRKMPSESKRRIEKMVFEGQWHGWLECTSPASKCHLILRLNSIQYPRGLSMSPLARKPLNQLASS